MNRFLLAGLCALAAGLAGGNYATAQCPGSAYGCRGLCMITSPCLFKHGPLVNYSTGTWFNYCGAGGCGHGGFGGCGHGGCGHNGLFGHGDGIGKHGGIFHRGGGCDTCGNGHGGFLSHIGHRHGDGCNTCGHSLGTSFATIRARLHLGHKCDSGCDNACGTTSACGTSSACDSTCGGRHWGGLFGHKDGCGRGCGDGCGLWGRLRGRLGLLDGGHGCGGGLFGRHGCGGGLFGRRGCGDGGCGNGGCGHGLCGLFCLFRCGPGPGLGSCCIGKGANYGGYGTQVARYGLHAGPWYLYWPTPDGQLQVPGPNAAGWAGNHFVMPAPYGPYSQAAGANPYFSATAGVNPYFPNAGGGNPYFPAR